MNILIACLTASLLIACGTANATSIDLDSAQEKALKDAEYHLKEVEKKLPKLVKLAESIEEGTTSLTPTELHKTTNDVTFLAQKMGTVKGYLESLPADDAAVKKTTTRAETAMKSILEVATVIGNGGGQPGQIDEQSIRTDSDAFGKLTTRIAYSDVIRNDPARAAEIVEELPKMKAYRDSMEAKYGSMFGDSRVSRIEATVRQFDSCLPRFQKDAENAVPQILTEIQRHLDDSARIVDIAIERKRVASFTDGSIEGSLVRAEDSLALLEAIVGKTGDAKAAAKKVKAQRKKVLQAGVTLETDIIASNAAPSDLYSGADKQSILERVSAAWSKAHKGSKVLGMRIPMRKWERWTGIRWAHDHYQLIDESSLQVAIVVDAGKGQAHIYYAHLKMDHQAGDDISIKLDDRGDVPAYRKLLRKNFE